MSSVLGFVPSSPIQLYNNVQQGNMCR